MKGDDEIKPLEEKELIMKFKMKGRNSAKRRFLRKEKHIHDNRSERIRTALDASKKEEEGEGAPVQPKTILDRFKYKEQ